MTEPIKDNFCVMRFTMEEAFEIEKSVYNSYAEYFKDGYLTKAKFYLNLFLKIERFIKSCKGYEDHKSDIDLSIFPKS